MNTSDIYNRGKTPDWAWMQMNGKSAWENYRYQKKKIHNEIERRNEAKRREEAKKEIEKQLLEAIAYTMEQGSEIVAEATANDIISSINAALTGAPAPSSKKSFTAELGVILGRALGQAPFKLLEELFRDDDTRGK